MCTKFEVEYEHKRRWYVKIHTDKTSDLHETYLSLRLNFLSPKAEHGKEIEDRGRGKRPQESVPDLIVEKRGIPWSGDAKNMKNFNELQGILTLEVEPTSSKGITSYIDAHQQSI